MGDILSDDRAFMHKIGPEICHDTIGSVRSHAVNTVTDEEIESPSPLIMSVSTSTPTLGHASHAIAVREYFGFKNSWSKIITMLYCSL